MVVFQLPSSNYFLLFLHRQQKTRRKLEYESNYPSCCVHLSIYYVQKDKDETKKSEKVMEMPEEVLEDLQERLSLYYP